MFLRCNRRFKDGKEHRYWNIVEAHRVASGRTVQRQVLYLGEINDKQQTSWQRTIDLFTEGEDRSQQVALFAEDSPTPQSDEEVVYPLERTGTAPSAEVGRMLACLRALETIGS
jgi:hypothetical protein